MTFNRLVRLELESFRGFVSTRRLDLDAGVVLVRGDNGTGKTSVTDGLLWLMTGTIPRLVERTRGYRKGKDPIVSGYREGQPARVRLTVRMPDNRLIDLERLGNADRSELTAWSDGEQLPDSRGLLVRALGLTSGADVDEAVSSWGILQQHSVLAALDGGAALHERLADIVGLDRVTRFTAAAGAASTTMAAERKQLEQTLERLRDQRSKTADELHIATNAAEPGNRPLLSTLVRTSLEGLPPGISVAQTPSQLDEIAALGREVTAAVGWVQPLIDHAATVQKVDDNAADALANLEREVQSLMERAQAAVARAPLQVQLATAALELVGAQCPVCGQDIDEASVRQHMTELVSAAQIEASQAGDAQRAVAAAQVKLGEARSLEARQAAAREALHIALDALHRGLEEAEWLSIASSWQTARRSHELHNELMALQRRLREVYSKLRTDAGADVARFAAELETQDIAIERTQRDLARARERADHASALDIATRTAAQRIVERALERLGPSFAEVYDRLSPHPTFRELRATQDIFYKKNQVLPEVWDPVNKVGGNPAVLLSEGQLNVVALSYFLGLALNAGDNALPFIVLDDPLQAMDVLSVLGFADLCRRIREHRQLILTTHDRRFATLLARKLAPRELGTRTLMHEFEGWTEDGPHVRTVDEPLAEVIPLLTRRAS